MLKNFEKWSTDDEKFALDYFHKKGKYEKFQDLKIPPNLYDTRQTFLKKIKNPEIGQEFLKNYNEQNPIAEN